MQVFKTVTLKKFRCTGCTTYSTPAAVQIRSNRCTDFGRTDAQKYSNSNIIRILGEFFEI